MFFKQTSKKQPKGTAMLLIVIVLTASALITASSMAYLSLGELDMGYTYQCGEEAFALADGCMEEALRRIKLDSGYSGGNLVLGGGNCIIEVTGSAENRTINASSQVNNCSRDIESIITLVDGEITVNSWREVEN